MTRKRKLLAFAATGQPQACVQRVWNHRRHHRAGAAARLRLRVSSRSPSSAPLTGDYANLGLNMSSGVSWPSTSTTRTNADCKVKLTEFDSQGDPEKATPLATQIVNDDKIVGVVGPGVLRRDRGDRPDVRRGRSGHDVTASATNPDLSKNGWETFHRVLGNDDTQGPAAAKYIRDTLEAKKVFVIDDASEYGKGLADGVKKDLGDLVDGHRHGAAEADRLRRAVTKVKAAGADASSTAATTPRPACWPSS